METPSHPNNPRGARRGSIGLGQILLWSLCVLGVLGLLVVLAVQGLQKLKSSSTQQKAMSGLLRRLAAASDQFVLEHGYRVFITYDDLVGPDRYIKVQISIVGEDYRTLFPRRATWPMVIVAPGGQRAVYDFGEDPPQPDGVAIETWPDGRRFATTWLDGKRHGPFRAYYASGSLWSEATLEHDRVVEAWLHTPGGQKFNELTDGARAVAAIHAELAAASADTRRSGEEKLRARDYAGAVARPARMVGSQAAELALRSRLTP